MKRRTISLDVPEQGAVSSMPAMAASPGGDAPSFLNRKQLRLIIFSGKGGVGKTTSSAATAIYLARRHPDSKIVVASSDPAHSVADSLDCPVNGAITQVKGVANLWAIELDAAALLKKFQRKHRSSIQTLKTMSYSSDQADLRDFFSFTLPGMEDMALLLEIGRLLKGGYAFDCVILDTAPTGHTLRLLSLPGQVSKWIELFRASVAGFRWFSGALASQQLFHTTSPGNISRRPRGSVRRFLEDLSKDLARLEHILADTEATEFVPVTIAEEMSIAETGRLVRAVNTAGIPVRNMIVNRVQQDSGCAFCAGRSREQAGYLQEIHEKFGAYNLIRMPLLPHEVRGVDALSEYAAWFVRQEDLQDRSAVAVPREVQAPTALSIRDGVTEGLRLPPALESVVFCGKGGVGKTTSSAATALSMAEGDPDRKILIVSLDPAHSLADSFACPIGDGLTPIPCNGRLYAMEIDGAKLYRELKRDYEQHMERAFRKIKSSGRYAWGREAKLNIDHKLMQGFVDAYPPGVEDALALERISAVLAGGEYDICVIDTAPTGHLVKLLQTPQLVIDWLKSASRAMMKYQREHSLDDIEQFNERIFATFASIRRMQAVLTHPGKGAFVAVTIAEAMGVLETEDLLREIGKLGMPVGNVIVNMVVSRTECDFCTQKRAEQLAYLGEMHRKAGGFANGITTVPLFPHEIRGVERLREISGILCRDGVGASKAPEASAECTGQSVGGLPVPPPPYPSRTSVLPEGRGLGKGDKGSYQ